MGTVLTAVAVKYTFPYGWSWTLSLLFGAMFSATDPVAVVAVLREVRSRSTSNGGSNCLNAHRPQQPGRGCKPCNVILPATRCRECAQHLGCLLPAWGCLRTQAERCLGALYIHLLSAWLGMRNRLNEELRPARQAGMEKQLRTLVDLEALLNDGTAYVLFFLLRVWAEGRHQSAGDAVRCCPRMGYGSTIS